MSISNGTCADSAYSADAVLEGPQNTPLIGACRYGNDEMVRFLCERVSKAHIDHQTSSNRLSALIDAATRHSPDWQLLVLTPVNEPWDFFTNTPNFCMPHLLERPRSVMGRPGQNDVGTQGGTSCHLVAR